MRGKRGAGGTPSGRTYSRRSFTSLPDTPALAGSAREKRRPVREVHPPGRTGAGRRTDGG